MLSVFAIQYLQYSTVLTQCFQCLETVLSWKFTAWIWECVHTYVCVCVSVCICTFYYTVQISIMLMNHCIGTGVVTHVTNMHSNVLDTGHPYLLPTTKLYLSVYCLQKFNYLMFCVSTHCRYMMMLWWLRDVTSDMSGQVVKIWQHTE